MLNDERIAMMTERSMYEQAAQIAGILPFEYFADTHTIRMSDALRQSLLLEKADMPFSAFTQVFSPLSAQLLTESFLHRKEERYVLELILANTMTVTVHAQMSHSSIVGYLLVHAAESYRLHAMPTIEDYRDTFRLLRQIEWVMDNEISKILSISDTVEIILGYTSDEFYNNPLLWMQSVVPEDNEIIVQSMQELRLRGSVTISYRLITKTGEQRWVHTFAWAEKNSAGEVLYYRGITRDITHEKNNEKLIEIQRDNFRDMAINVPGVIYQWYEKSNGDYGFTFVSPKLKEIFDIEPGDMNTVAELIHPDDKKRWRESIDHSKNNHTPWYFEGRLLYPDGHIKWWQGKSVIFRRNEEEVIYNGIMLDITEKIENLEYVEQQQRRLESIRLGTTIGTWELDIETGKTIWSDEVYTIHEVPLGFDHDSVNGIEFYHADYRPIISDAVHKAIHDSVPFDVVCVLISAKGNHKWVRSTGKRIGNKIIGSFQDITNIQERELMFEGIFNSTISLIGFLNTDGILLEVNTTALALCGVERKDVVGKYFWDCPWWKISTKTRDELQHNFARALSGEDIMYEVEIAIAGNRTMTILFSLRPVFDEQGKVLYVIPEGRPVDDVVETRDRFKSVLEGTNVGTWEWNIQTGETIFNERWAEIIGYTLEELQPVSIETWTKFAHADDLERSAELLRQHFEGEKDYYECEARMRHKNGEWIWVLDRGKVSKWTTDGKPLLMSGTHQDINERKQYQSELISAKSAAEKANIAKSVFLSNMSHELRTPLNAVLGFAQILLADKTLTSQHHEYIRTMYQSGSHLLKLLNDILDISKIEAGKMILAHDDFSLREILRDIDNMFKVSCRQKKIQFVVSMSTQLPPLCTGDEKRLRQLLINLVGNAVKFTEKGTVTLRVDCEQKEPQYYAFHFSINDTGKGIPKDHIPFITQAFYQVNALSNEGTGLGLSICTRILEMMNSELVIESEEDIGSTFSFTLVMPAHQTASDRRMTPSEAQKKSEFTIHAPTALIADDVASNRFFLVSLLKTKGYRCFEADNGEDALALFIEHLPKVLLLDIKMPRMDGVECAHKIKEYCALHHYETPYMIAVTAGIMTGLHHEDEFDYSVFDTVIHKPINVRELWDILRNAYTDDVIELDHPSLDETVHTLSLHGDIEECAALISSPNFSRDIAEAIEFQEFDDCISLIEQMKLTDENSEKHLWHIVADHAKKHDAFFFIKLAELFER